MGGVKALYLKNPVAAFLSQISKPEKFKSRKKQQVLILPWLNATSLEKKNQNFNWYLYDYNLNDIT